MKLATRDAIREQGSRSVREQFGTAAPLLKDGTRELINAISVSYLGGLLYGDLSHPRAHCVPPSPLASALETITRHQDERMRRGERAPIQWTPIQKIRTLKKI